MTEAEAGNKFCPYTFAATLPKHGDHPPWHCKGQGCMAWRWKGFGPETLNLSKDSVPPGNWIPDSYVADGTTNWKEKHGHCGLAGEP